MTGVCRLLKPMLGFRPRDRLGEAPSQEKFGRQANILLMRFYESVSRSSECFILVEVQGVLSYILGLALFVMGQSVVFVRRQSVVFVRRQLIFILVSPDPLGARRISDSSIPENTASNDTKGDTNTRDYSINVDADTLVVVVVVKHTRGVEAFLYVHIRAKVNGGQEVAHLAGQPTDLCGTALTKLALAVGAPTLHGAIS